jgi:uncharacterized protein with HEPN domain
MIEAAETALDFIANRQSGDLDTDLALVFAVTRAIEIIGEAASRVSMETRSACPTVPWSQIISMRNRLIHVYFNIDRDILWKTVSVELPPLLSVLRSLTSQE